MLAVGIVLGLCMLWPHPRMSEVTGVITAASVAPQMYSGTGSLVKYRYTVGGRTYSGEQYLRYAPRYEEFFRVGSPIAVYFDPARPEDSTLRSGIFRWAVLVGAAVFAIVGICIILFALSL